MLERIDHKSPKWFEFVNSHPESTIFHHPLWSSVLAECYGYRPFIWIRRAENGEIHGGLPVLEIDSWLTGRRFVSLPFTDHCCPLFNNEKDQSIFLQELVEETKKNKDLRYEVHYSLPPFFNDNKENEFYFHYLKLDKSPAQLFEKFRKKSVQYGIRKALKSGVTIHQSKSSESMMTFYRLHTLTRKRHGVPTQPKKYFRILWQLIIKQGLGFILIASFKDRPIAGGLFLNFNKKLVYKYGATDPDYMHSYATHVLLWHSIQWGYENGMALMDLGRSDIDNEGLRQFKRGWNTEEYIMSYSCLGKTLRKYSGGWKQRILKEAVRKTPTLTGRIIGELLYKHMG